MKVPKSTLCIKRYSILIAFFFVLFIINNIFNKNYEKTTRIGSFSKEYIFKVFYQNITIINSKNLSENKVDTSKSSCPICTISKKYKSTCGQPSDDLGLGQKVISYAFFKENDDFMKYTQGIEENILSMRSVYNLYEEKPWVIRIYSDIKVPLNLTQKYPNELFWCDVREIIPDSYYSKEKMNYHSWRFLVLGDPTVDIFLSRDLDGILTKREKDAVDEWLMMPNYPFHSMRDNPKHKHLFLAGMWGAKNTILGLEKAQALRHEFMESGNMNDQQMLEKTVKKYTNEILSHDSFHCKEYGGYVKPWPTQRNPSGDFVGKPVFRYKNNRISEECPIECRPELHKDWIYC